jgi:plasmid stabilization system protein ParE
MSLKIIESDQVIDDVISTADRIAQQAGLNASDRFLQAVKGAYRQIADMPGLGSVQDYGQPELKGMRRWHITKFPKYLVFYIVTPAELIILRVLHGSQDIETIFAPSEE